VTILMAWTDATTILDRFTMARRLIANALPIRARPGRTYQGFIKALLRRRVTFLPRVQRHLRSQVRRVAGEQWRCGGWLAFTVDGTRIECPRTRANERALGKAGRTGCAPQLQLTSILHLGTMLPWAWTCGPARTSERSHLRAMIDLLPKGSLLVADAGFAGHELLSDVQARGLHLLVRVGANLTLLTRLGWSAQTNGSTVFLWPSHRRDRPPLVLRMIRLKTGRGRSMVLLTNVREATRLSRRQAADLYRRRWGVEIFHRSFKQTLSRRRLRSAAPRQARMELHGIMIALTLLGLMSVSELIRRGVAAARCSVAAALRTVRQCMHGGAANAQALRRQLAHAEIDSYQRRRSKAARDWPHKKNDPPPGVPHVRAATAPEVQRAKHLAARINMP